MDIYIIIEESWYNISIWISTFHEIGLTEESSESCPLSRRIGRCESHLQASTNCLLNWNRDGQVGNGRLVCMQLFQSVISIVNFVHVDLVPLVSSTTPAGNWYPQTGDFKGNLRRLIRRYTVKRWVVTNRLPCFKLVNNYRGILLDKYYVRGKFHPKVSFISSRNWVN